MKASAANETETDAGPTLARAFRKAGLMTWNPRTLLKMARAIHTHGFRPSSFIAIAAARDPHHVAVADDFGTITFEALYDRVQKLASALHERFHVGPDMGVAIMCRNHRTFIEAVLAASTASADALLLNTEFPGPQLAQVLGHHQLGCAIHDPEFTPAFEQSAYAGNRIVTGSESDGLTVEDLIRTSSGPLAISRESGKIVILTSGTTGVPKGAARAPKFRAVSGPLATLLTKVPLHAKTTVMIASPVFHGFGLAFLGVALLLGATIVLRRRADPDEILADIVRHRVEVLIAVPTMLKRLLELAEPIRSQYDLSSLKAVLSSGAALGASLGSRFMQAFGPCLYDLYGSSETGFGAIATPEDLLAAPGTVGYPPAGTSIRLIDSAGQEVAAGQIGRVFLRTGLVFAGYVGGGNKETIDGFMSTGDLGHVDADGRLFIDGRIDDMIVSGGEKVFPLEVEELLANHPAVMEAAVIGVADEKFGQRLKAFVVVRAGEAIDEESLRNYLKERIARFKVPREFIFLSQLPRNAAGKVLKRELVSSRA